MPFLQIHDRNRALYYTWTTPPASAAATPRDISTIIFIHGLGSSSSFYASIIPDLAKAGYQCLALDSHGAGLTPFTGQDGGIDQIVKDVGEAIEGLEISPNRTIIVGHSMGGIVAPEVALRYEIAGVVLLGPVHPNDGLAEIFNARIKVVEENGMDVVADVIPIVGTGPKATALHRAFIRALVLSQNAQGYISNCRAISESKLPEYSKIKSPVLIIAGSHDKVCPIHLSQTIFDSWGSSEKRIEVLDQIGHWHCIEAPEEVGSAILEFANNLNRNI